MFEKLRRKSKDPSVNPYMRLIDPDLGMPETFYMMDEIGRDQVLRRFNKCDGEFCYTGTFRILYKTERLKRHCLIMRRRPDERRVPDQFRVRGPEDMQSLVIAEYYPGVMSRIYLKGLSENLMQDITDEYIRRVLRRKRRRLLPMGSEDQVGNEEEY